MMKLQATLSPTASPVVSGPSSSMIPEISWPSTQGVGNATSPLITCKSVWHTPHATTRTRTSFFRGFGICRDSTAIRPPVSDRTFARMVLIPLLHRFLLLTTCLVQRLFDLDGTNWGHDPNRSALQPS